MSSIQPEICMYFLRQEITPFTAYYLQNATLDSFFLNATRCSLTSARMLGAGICSQIHGALTRCIMAGTRFCFVLHTTEEEDSTWTLRGEGLHMQRCSSATSSCMLFSTPRVSSPSPVSTSRSSPPSFPSCWFFSPCLSQTLLGVGLAWTSEERCLQRCSCLSIAPVARLLLCTRSLNLSGTELSSMYFFECSLPLWTFGSPSGQQRGM